MAATEVVAALCLGPDDQPPVEGPNGEIDGAAGSEGNSADRAPTVEAGRELAATDAGAEPITELAREAEDAAAGRAPDEVETPLSSSSSGINRCAWMSLSRPSSR